MIIDKKACVVGKNLINRPPTNKFQGEIIMSAYIGEIDCHPTFFI